ncbi:MAG: hypothetical protein COA36_00580 [Desulfotalea sp.]|nr:MAG: hypothetical protein COA36_00580 [Desulfotalea sp.]
MIGESGGVTALVYQEQVGRQNQIQRDPLSGQEIEEEGRSPGSGDVASFSTEGLELARTAVVGKQGGADVDLEQESEEEQSADAGQQEDSLPAQFLDISA